MEKNTANSVFQGKNVRFTVVHPNCIRMEESANGRFVDEPSLFAVCREARHEAAIEQKNGKVVIDTGGIRLTYHADGHPLNAANLQAKISSRRNLVWRPGQANTANLGGTAETLDGWIGARTLPDGLLSRDGWHVIDDSTRPLLVDGWVRARQAPSTDWYLFGYDTDFRAAFQALAAISGPVPMPRRYTLGAWYSRYWPYTSADYRGFVSEYEKNRFPLDVMVMDMDWHINDIAKAPGAIQSGSNNQVWTGYSWDRDLLPDAEKLLAELHSEGLYVTLNDHPANGVQLHEEMYRAFMKAMGHPADGTIIPFDASDRKYLETFYKHTHANLEKDGVDFWWLDWQQDRDTRSISSLRNLEWLNYYFYQRSMDNGMRGQSFSRWGGWGDHRHPIHFSGDADTGWAMLAFQVPFTATAGNVGCFFWSHDIGGHQGGRSEESYTRWCQFGAFSAALRSHSTRKPDMDRRPWTYPTWALNSMRQSFSMRSEWFPYLYTCAAQACSDTFPFLRPMYLMHPEVEDAYRNPQQYMVGNHMLVAPIAEPGIGPRKLARQAVWFPEGIWFNVFTGEQFEGPVERLVSADIDEMPLYVRGGTALPTQPYTPRMGKGTGEKLIIRCWPGVAGQTVETEIYEDDGETGQYQNGEKARTRLICTQTADGIMLTIEPTEGTFTGQITEREITVLLPCTQRAEKVVVDGNNAKGRYNAKRMETSITLPKASVLKRRVVEVIIQPSAPMIHRITAFARRAAFKTVEQFPDLKTCFREAMQKASEIQVELAMRAVGAGIFNKPETFYGLSKTSTMMLYIPDDIDVSRKARLSTAGAVISLPTQFEKQSIDSAELLRQLPIPADELMREPQHMQWKLTLTVGSVKVAMQEDVTVREPYWPFLKNLAPAATATASSWMETQPPAAAIDGIVSGIPRDALREWASRGETAGAWLRLDWKKKVTAGKVLLFDRPNAADHVTAGRLILSDGTVLPVGELPADGNTPYEVAFEPRPIQWMMFVVTGVSASTGWTGLSEVAVYAS